jgi:hypothetical protein
MKNSSMLKIASLLSILLFMFHLADDIARGIEKGGVSNLTAIPIYVLWAYGTLMLGERRSGYIIMLLGSLFALLPPVLHMTGKGIGAGSYIARTGGSFFFAWTLLAIGTTGLFSLILSARGLWSLKWGKSR